MAPNPRRRDDISRRTFLAGATALAARPGSFLTPDRRALAASPVRWPGYEDAIVIDCLASPGYFPTGYPQRNGLDFRR